MVNVFHVGKAAMLDILTRIANGEGKEGDIELLQDLGNTIKKTSLCGLGQSAPNPVLSTIRYFRDEYEAHIREKRCPAGVCTALAQYEILAENCTGCGLCAKVCPVEAISFYEIENPNPNAKRRTKRVYKIDSSKCIKCGACAKACRFNAIVRR